MKTFIFKIVTFMIILIILFGITTNIFSHKQTTFPYDVTRKIDGFYEEPKNSLDVIFVGSSQMFFSVNPNLIWRDAGIPSYVFAANEQPLWISYFYILEALKYQSPKVVVLDVLYAHRLKNEEYAREGVNKLNIDNIKTSRNKWEMIKASVPAEQRFGFMFKIYNYHDRWKSLTKDDFTYPFADKSNLYKGYTYSKNKFPYDGLIHVITDEIGEVTGKNLEYLMRIIELSKEKGFELLLIKTPSIEGYVSADFQKTMNAVSKIALENGVDFINFDQRWDDLKLDYKTDFYDQHGHLNEYGANKVSGYLAHYLQQYYSLKDKRSLDKYTYWNDNVSSFFEISNTEQFYIDLKEVPNLRGYLAALQQKDHYIAITSVKDEASNQLINNPMDLSPLGIDVDFTEKYRWSFIGVYDKDREYSYGEILDGQLTFSIEQNLPFQLDVISAGQPFGNQSSIKINDVEYSKNRRGLNIVIYDTLLNRVVDSFNVDSHGDGSLQINR